MIWFAPFEGFGDAGPLGPSPRSEAPPRPAVDEAHDEPAPAAHGEERPPPRCSIK